VKGTPSDRYREDDEQALRPVHPCEVLLEEFLVTMDISQYRLAKDINV
jgi:plasmid maintenance system antidote protein VapI